MITPPLCSRANLIAEYAIPSAEDTTQLDRYIEIAGQTFCQETARTYTRATVNGAIITGRDLAYNRGSGILLIRLPAINIQTVSAVSTQVGIPTNAYTAINVALATWQTSRTADLVTVYTTGGGDKPRAAQVSYVAGWVGDNTDPYPADLQEIVLWLAGWIYRTKDAPMGATANPALGTIDIPQDMPKRIKAKLEKWKATAAY